MHMYVCMYASTQYVYVCRARLVMNYFISYIFSFFIIIFIPYLHSYIAMYKVSHSIVDWFQVKISFIR